MILRLLIAFSAISTLAIAGESARPLMRDFMGINGHYHFRPALYRSTCALVRNYHPVVWDIGNDGSQPPILPSSRIDIDGGVVNWATVYGAWKAEGFRIDASLQFESVKPEKWKDRKSALQAYGRAFAKTFGPSSASMLVESAEIGNEPVDYDDATYRKVFEELASGLREGDPKLKIVTAAARAKGSDKYAKPIDTLAGLESLFDVINVHSYSMIEGWPTWRRVYPEHRDIPYLAAASDLLAWRDQHAPGKEVWLTEFGYDASTKPPPSTGTMSRWVSSSETEQAQWIVRSFLVFAALGVDRAYVYYYNDDDTPGFHASSGLTRNFVPKPAFRAMAHLFHTLGDSRFVRVISEIPDDIYVYEFETPEQPGEKIWAIWSPTGTQRETIKTLSVPGKIVKAERMPLADDETIEIKLSAIGDKVTLPVTESPAYLTIQTR